jgi:hypothetical protein
MLKIEFIQELNVRIDKSMSDSDNAGLIQADDLKFKRYQWS